MRMAARTMRMAMTMAMRVPRGMSMAVAFIGRINMSFYKFTEAALGFGIAGLVTMIVAVTVAVMTVAMAMVATMTVAVMAVAMRLIATMTLAMPCFGHMILARVTRLTRGAMVMVLSMRHG